MSLDDFQIDILSIAQDVLSGEYSELDASDLYGLTDAEARRLHDVLDAEGYFG